MADVTIKRNDTASVINDTLTTAAGPVNLTGATVAFHAKRFYFYGGTVQPTINAAATIVTATAGTVKFVFGAAATALATGLYECEWQVTYSDQTIQTFPSGSDFILEVVADVA